jgi:hypothetical protein
MEVGETVVFVGPVQGVEAGRHGRVMGLAEDKLMVECRVRERLECLLVNTWEVLPEQLWRRLLKRRLAHVDKERNRRTGVTECDTWA